MTDTCCILFGAVVMALGAWLANLIPATCRGRHLVWAACWGLPAGLAVWGAGMTWVGAVWMACAGTAGAVVPAGPAERLGAGHPVRDMAELLVEGVLRLLPVGLVLYAVDLYWPKAIEAAGLILPAYLAGRVMRDRLARLQWAGLRSPSDFGAVLFAAGTGAILAITPLLPRHTEWPPVPAVLAPLDQAQ